MAKLSDIGMVRNEYFILDCDDKCYDDFFPFEWRFENKTEFDLELFGILNNLDTCGMFKIIGSFSADRQDAFFMDVIKKSVKVVSEGDAVFVKGLCKFSYPIPEGSEDKMFTTHEHYGDDYLCEFWNAENGGTGIYIYLGKIAAEMFSMHN